ncbi:MAG: leucyl/phenylalanyl-tRNA--protein transferase [Pseudomonadota bacterium]
MRSPIPFLEASDDLTPFPPADTAMADPNGLLMAGANLKPERLMQAYRAGIFPWYSDGEPILWWSPDPRCVIWPDKLKISRSLRKTIRRQVFTVSHNMAFERVIQQCSKPRPGSDGTWITTDMATSYCELARRGHAESIEVWCDDELIGGLYGVVVGKVFVGESMFSKQSDASKVALVALAGDQRFSLIDCQLPTEHLISMGATNLSRHEYLAALKILGRQ